MEKHGENRITKILILLADELNDLVILKTILEALPIIWTTVVAPAFHNVFYNSNTGNMNALGIIVAVALATLSIFVLILTNIKSRKDRLEKKALEKEIESYKGEIDLRRALSEAENTLEERRNRNFRSEVEKMEIGDSIKPFVANAMNPMERISTALEGLNECFSNLSDISKSEYTLSGAITAKNKNSNKNNSWEWITRPTIEGTASLEELLKNKSAFNIVANGKPFYYANNKEKAAGAGEYYLDGRDVSYGGGSIVCAEIDEEIGNWRIRLIISISTYGKQIVSEDEIEAGADLKVVYEDRIRDTILKQFEGELKEDLLWYGIENIDFKNNKYKRNQITLDHKKQKLPQKDYYDI